MPLVALKHILKNEITDCAPITAGKAVLLEPQNPEGTSTLRSVTIVGLPSKTLILDADKMSVALFREKDDFCQCHAVSRYRKKCDYIIVTELEQQDYILYIEMKTSPRDKKHIMQLWCGRCLMEYLNFAMANLEKIVPHSGHFEHRFVKFCRVPIDKETTGLQEDYKNNDEPKEKNDKPAKAYKYFVTEGIPVQLKKLL